MGSGDDVSEEGGQQSAVSGQLTPVKAESLLPVSLLAERRRPNAESLSQVVL